MRSSPSNLPLANTSGQIPYYLELRMVSYKRLSGLVARGIPTLSTQIQPSSTTKVTNRANEGNPMFNVVIYGIDECSKGTPRREQFNHDLDKVTTIVTETESRINPLSIRDILRLGKYHDHSQKPRPVLVRFNRAIDMSLLLSKASKCQNTSELNQTCLKKNAILSHFS